MSATAVVSLSIFVFISLLAGVVLRLLSRKTKFPYTPMVLVFGILWGLAADYIGVPGEGAIIWNGTDPHTILLVFIPALIYESAYGSDFHLFRREIVSILLLAIPGVVISTILTAITMRFVL
jgi:NhaP-type Na+/H+ or K+/H+ antiporter